MSRIAATHVVTIMNLIIIIVLSNPHYPGATLLFQRDIADDEGSLAVAFLEVESLWRGIERLEGKREVCIAQVTHEVFGGIRCFHGGKVVLVKLDSVGCCHFILLAVGLKVGILDDAEPIFLMTIIAETDGGAVGICFNFSNGQLSIGTVVLLDAESVYGIGQT